MNIVNPEDVTDAEEKEVQLEKISLDPKNVRFQHLSKQLSDKQIEEQIWKEPDTLALYKQILSAGLYEKPLLNFELTVIEGNRRIVCLRRLKQALDKGELAGISKGSFDKVKCAVLPKGTSPQKMDLYLAAVHVKGKKPWKTFNKAKHISNLHEIYGLSYDYIAKAAGMGKATVIRAVEVYMATEEYGKNHLEDREWFHKFTYFEELCKRKDLKEFRSDIKNMKKFSEWVFYGKFKDVRDVRKLALILHDAEALEELKRKNFDSAMKVIESKDPSITSPEFKKIKESIEIIRALSRKELIKTINDSSRLNLLHVLKKELDALIKDIKSIGKS